jgi:DNA invertase Pin-like site-specific DNA recombinase
MKMNNKRVGIYARVSTKNKQEIDNQLLQLHEYCLKNGYTVYKEYVDHESGGNPHRKAFKELFMDAYQKKFSIVLFWALDRFSREGARETINYLSELESYGVHFISYTEPYLNSIGIFKEAIISILATLARQEKVRLTERVKAGLENARRKGKKLGKKALPPVYRKKVLDIHETNPSMSVRTIAKKVGQSVGGVHKTLSLFREGKCDREGFLLN